MVEDVDNKVLQSNRKRFKMKIRVVVIDKKGRIRYVPFEIVETGVFQREIIIREEDLK